MLFGIGIMIAMNPPDFSQLDNIGQLLVKRIRGLYISQKHNGLWSDLPDNISAMIKPTMRISKEKNFIIGTHKIYLAYV